jgi:hypothetical protein
LQLVDQAKDLGSTDENNTNNGMMKLQTVGLVFGTFFVHIKLICDRSNTKNIVNVKKACCRKYFTAYDERFLLLFFIIT